MADDPRPIQSKPTISIEFDAVNSSVATLTSHHTNYMQLFAAAKLLEMHAETAFMQEQIRNAQKSGGLVIPKVIPGQPPS